MVKKKDINDQGRTICSFPYQNDSLGKEIGNWSITIGKGVLEGIPQLKLSMYLMCFLIGSITHSGWERNINIKSLKLSTTYTVTSVGKYMWFPNIQLAKLSRK